ncbi:MAG: hypothetical protein GY928_12020 [Colwellia sp.]|nr:hypothetical protein [Colwellia sp.]
MTESKILTSKLNYSNMNIQKEITEKLVNDLDNQLEKAIILGLEKKGFTFDNKPELYSFIKKRCHSTENIDTNEKIFYVDDIPFFLFIRNTDFKMDYEDKIVKATAELGQFKYL